MTDTGLRKGRVYYWVYQAKDLQKSCAVFLEAVLHSVKICSHPSAFLMLTGLVGIILPNAEYSGRIGLKALILGQEDAEEEVTWCNAVAA